MIIYSKYGYPPSDYKHFVYRHIRIDKNEPFYIGIGTVSNGGLYNRAFTKKRNNLWAKITDKTNYRVEILFETNYKQEAFGKEIEFIKLYGRISDNSGILANLTTGGEGVTGFKFNQETIEGFRLRQLGSKKPKETLKNMSLAQLNRYKINGISPKCLPVYQYTIEGVFIKRWDSGSHAAKSLGHTSLKAITAVKTDSHHAFGSLWYQEYMGESFLPTQKIVKVGSIIQTDMNGQFIAKYKSIKLASISVFGSRVGVNYIKLCCSEKRESYRNFKWKYND